MKRVVRHLVVGLLLYAVFLAAQAPASFVLQAVGRHTDGRVTLSELHGTLWRGDAVVLAGRDARRLGVVHWRVDGLWLLLGRVHADIEMNEPELKLRSVVTLSHRSLRLADTQASLSASVAEAFYTPLELLGLRGQVRIHSDTFAIDADGAAGTMDWFIDNVASRSSTVAPLGSYRLSLNGDGAEVKIALTTASGDLALAGQGEWRPGSGALRFEGAARPLARAAELEPLLQLLGPDRGKGQRALAANLNFAW